MPPDLQASRVWCISSVILCCPDSASRVRQGNALCKCECMCCFAKAHSCSGQYEYWQLAACLAKHRQAPAVPLDSWCMRSPLTAWPGSHTPLPAAGSCLRVCSQHSHPAGPALGLPRALPRSPGGRLPADILCPRTATGGRGFWRSSAGAGWGDLCGLHTPDEHHPGMGLQVGAAWTS